MQIYEKGNLQPLPAFVFQEKRAYFREYSGDFGGFGRVGFSFDLGFIGDSGNYSGGCRMRVNVPRVALGLYQI